jgi:hypothetical protein
MIGLAQKLRLSLQGAKGRRSLYILFQVNPLCVRSLRAFYIFLLLWRRRLAVESEATHCQRHLGRIRFYSAVG